MLVPRDVRLTFTMSREGRNVDRSVAHSRNGRRKRVRVGVEEVVSSDVEDQRPTEPPAREAAPRSAWSRCVIQ